MNGTEIAWKAGESEVICLHGGLRLCRLISDEWRKIYLKRLLHEKARSYH